jgi:hypothetical protein
MWRVYRAAGREWPVLSPDEVIDFKIAEAVYLKVQKEEADAQNKQMREDWKKKTEDLRTRVETGGGAVGQVR